VAAAAETLIESPDPFNAWLVARQHPERLTSLADTVLTALAQARTSVSDRVGIDPAAIAASPDRAAPDARSSEAAISSALRFELATWHPSPLRAAGARRENAQLLKWRSHVSLPTKETQQGRIVQRR
jgi:hypothetical protein